MAKREKKNNKKRLLLLIVLLMITAIMLSTATYAWFISNKTVSVDSLDVQARTSNGLEISADAVNWGVSINKANLISNSWAGHRN
jgi:flagellar basal body-associated protein FliL